MTTHKAMLATSHSLRDRLIEDLNDTQAYMRETKAKCVNFLCIEYLIGRLLQQILLNTNLYYPYKEALKEMGYEIDDLFNEDKDAALGNGGLGRLAACYMDSLSTMNIFGINYFCFLFIAWGYGIRYNYGMFEQKIKDGWQVEYPDFWLSFGNPWEIERTDIRYIIHFGGKCIEKEENGIKKVYLSLFYIIGSIFKKVVIVFLLLLMIHQYQDMKHIIVMYYVYGRLFLLMYYINE